MWPIQTLTLLLCLTDDEQLYAQQVQAPTEQVIESKVIGAEVIKPTDLMLDLSC